MGVVIDLIFGDNDENKNDYLYDNTDNLQDDNNPSNIINIIDNFIDSSNDCFFFCKECFGRPTLIENENGYTINQSCKICKNSYYLLFDTKNCYNDSIKELGYYLSSNDSMYHKCDIQCKTCEDNIILSEPNCT